MDFTSELLARLQKGESIDSLAAELTKAINDARTENERIKAEAEAKRKAEAEAKRRAEDKYDAIELLLCAVQKVIVAWDLGDDVLDVIQEIDTDELVQEFDEAILAAKAYVEMMEKLRALREARPVTVPMKTAPDLPAVGDPIEDFLNKFVR